MRRLIQTATMVLVLVALLAAPAVADRPVTFSDSVTFPDDDPCTEVEDPNEHMVTLNLEISIHEHRNNFVGHINRSGSTDSGYTMIAGTESFVDNGNVVRGSFMDRWQHPDGSKFRVSGHFTFDLNKGELRAEGGSFTCLGNK